MTTNEIDTSDSDAKSSAADRASSTPIQTHNVLLFGENPQAVAYSAQPLCWSG